LVPYDAVDSALTSLHKALAKQHFMAENVSDARAVFRIFGPKSREVLAKLCPVDLSTEAFQPGTIRRSRMAQIPAAIWMTDAQTLQVICFRSVADYAFGVLKVAAMPGSEVGYLA
jgi:sarcosine oxidase subunit gamma